MTSSANKKSSMTVRMASDSLRAPSFRTRSFTLVASSLTFFRTNRVLLVTAFLSQPVFSLY